MRSSYLKAAVLASLALSLATPVLAKSLFPASRGERLYTVIEQHNPAMFFKAATIANDSLKRGGKAAEIMLSGRAILMAVPGFTDVQKEIRKITQRQRGLRIIACKETVDLLRKSNKGRQPPFIAGVRVEACKGRARKNDAAGWQRMMGV